MAPTRSMSTHSTTHSTYPPPAADETSPTSDSESSSQSSPSRTQTQQRRNHHNTHTRRCRARLNKRFDSLNGMLPTQNAEVKHKVHILDHAITALGSLHKQNWQLELLLARRNAGSLIKWVDTFAPSATSFVNAINPMMRLICDMGNWPYAELLQLQQGGLRLESFMVASTPLLEGAFRQVGELSKGKLVKIEGEIGGRALEQGSYWGAGGRERMGAARVWGGMGVRVVVGGGGGWVMCFYDVRERERDEEHVKFARLGAAAVGNCWGGRTAT